jgi:poly-gamma-glutamate synthesis protein (capsule biosynthesis protein)
MDELLGKIRDCDLRFINLEMPLTQGGIRVPKMSNIRADPEVAIDLRSASGFDRPIVSLANNHMLDYGPQGLFDTIGTLKREGINHVGAGEALNNALQAHIATIRDRRIAFLSIATTLPPGSEAAADRPGIAPVRVTTSFDIDPVLLAEQPGTAPQVRTRLYQPDVEAVCDAVRSVARAADLIIVAVHWGVTSRMLTPFQNPIADYQPILARALIDVGADVIVGHHSHRIDGIEFYRDKPIFYGLGNFMFAAHRPHMAREGMFVRLEFDSQLHPCIRIIPFLLNDYGLPELATNPAEAAHVFDVLESASAQVPTQVNRQEQEMEATVEPTP